MTLDDIENLLAKWDYSPGIVCASERFDAAPALARLALDQAAEIASLQSALSHYVSEVARKVDKLAAKDARIAELKGSFEELIQWCDAYPPNVFPEPDLKLVAQVLEGAGLSLDAVSASNFRHVLNRVGKITRAALKDQPE